MKYRITIKRVSNILFRSMKEWAVIKREGPLHLDPINDVALKVIVLVAISSIISDALNKTVSAGLIETVQSVTLIISSLYISLLISPRLMFHFIYKRKPSKASKAQELHPYKQYIAYSSIPMYSVLIVASFFPQMFILHFFMLAVFFWTQMGAKLLLQVDQSKVLASGLVGTLLCIGVPFILFRLISSLTSFIR